MNVRHSIRKTVTRSLKLLVVTGAFAVAAHERRTRRGDAEHWVRFAVADQQAFPHELLFPAVLLAVTLICFNFLGDGLRDALDPKLKVD